MLKNYIRIAYRTLIKNRVFSLINIGGLGVGMAAFLFIVHYVRFERSYEDFHQNAESITRITIDFYNGSEYVVTDCETHAPMGPLLKEKMPEVVDFVRMFHNDGLQDISVGTDKFLEEGIYFADQSVFRVFSLDLLFGDPKKALTDPLSSVISASLARKYFGRTDVVGETIEIDGNRYHVTAVMADLPPNTHLKYSILLSHTSLTKLYSWYKEDAWNGNNEYTYLLMVPGTDLADFNKKLTALSISLKEKLVNARYTAEALGDIHLYSNKTYEPEVNGSARTVYFLMIIAFFIIAIAWVNYINLSTARAIERAREVGIRKVMGSMKAQLVFQFLSESVLVNVLAGALAFGLFRSALPLFSELTGQPLTFNFSDSDFWFLFASLLLSGSFLSGLYPAFVLSSFQPASVLKGKFQSSRHGQILRQGLVIVQFSSTIVLIAGLCTVYLQMHYLRTYELGMNVNQTLGIRAPQMPGSDSLFNSFYRTVKTELLRNPDIEGVARSGSLPGLSLHELSSTSFTRVGQEKTDGTFEYYFYSVDADFIPTLGMKLVAGRNFEKDVPNQDQVIINEEAVRTLGFSNSEEALGAKVTFRTRWPGEPSTIVGVLRNFYQRSPKEKHIPMLFKYGEGASYFTLRMKSQHLGETLTAIRTVWNKVLPGSVFHYFFLDERYDQQYLADSKFGQVMATFSALAVLIACLGLFGLSSYTIIQRTKEIGIRKVLGASVGQIVHLLSKDFAKVILIASLLALPIAYLAMKEWLSAYAVRISLNVWIFLLPVALILIISMVTVSVQTIKTALSNPTHSLKQE